MDSTILQAAYVMAGIAMVFAIILAIAYRFLHVEEDPRIEQLEDLLPGTNCGACGAPGCHAFAVSLVSEESVPAQCTVSGPEDITQIAEFLGVEAGSIERKVARLHCAGGKGFVREKAIYEGIKTCRGAVLVNAGGRDCAWGCLGLADCEISCGFDAIHMNQQGLPVVNVDLCTGCSDCVDVCPLDLFTLQPLSQKLVVQCNTPLAGEQARSLCSVACDDCGRCASDAAPGVIEMKDGLPRIINPSEESINATHRCPTGAIQWVEKNQFDFVPQPPHVTDGNDSRRPHV